mgnify:CR=1 FL=1
MGYLASSKVITRTMFEDFQVKGYWWIPGKEEEVSGILFYKQDKIELELLGTLNLDDSVFADVVNHEIILGLSDKGEQFTLLNTRVIKATTNFPGYATQSFSINAFLVGVHLKNVDESIFSSCAIVPTYLNTWLNRKVFDEDSTYKEGTYIVEEMQLSYKPPVTFNHYIPSINSSIEETGNANFKGNFNEEIIWQQKSMLRITPKELKDMKWLERNSFLLKDLLSLFIGQAIYLKNVFYYGEEIQSETNEKPYKPRYSFFFRQFKTKFKPNFTQLDILVPFSDIEQKFSSIIELWYEKQERLKTVTNLYFSEFYKDIYINTTFLNMVQTLEIYHRNFYDGKLFPKPTYRTYAKQVKEFANSMFPEDFAKKISDMMAYGNEYSLNNRLVEIINSFNDSTKSILIGNEEEVLQFVRQLVETRNYLTHYDANKKKHLLTDNEEKFFAIQRLKIIATIILFKEIGISEEVIVGRIIEGKKYQYSVGKAKELLNKTM